MIFTHKNTSTVIYWRMFGFRNTTLLQQILRIGRKKPGTTDMAANTGSKIIEERKRVTFTL
jgi:hypothetical protein